MGDSKNSKIDGKLLKGLDVKVGDITIRNYNLGYIFDDDKGLGLDAYYQALQPAVIKVSDFELENVLSEEVVSRLTLFDIPCMFKDVRELFIGFFNAFTYHEWEFNDVFNEFITHIEDDTLRINRRNIDDILEVVRKMYNVGHGLSKADQVFRSSEAEKALKEFEEWEDSLPGEKGDITLEGIIEGVTVKSDYTLFDIWDLTVYQLMRTFYKINDTEYIDNLTAGVYAGTIDGKAIKDLHWAKRTNS